MTGSNRLLARQRWLAGWLQPVLTMGAASRKMALALFLWGLGEGLWLYIRPLYVTSLGGNPVQVGQVLAAAGLAPVLLMLPAGRLIDRTGPRRLMLLTWWLGTAAAVILALAPGWQWLIPGFFLYAMSASSLPAINAYVARDAQLGAHPGQSVQAAISAVYAAYFAGTIFSPVIGGWLGQTFGLRTVFWISAVWFLLSTLTVLRTPELPWDHIHDAAGSGQPSTDAWWRMTPAQMRIYAVLLALFFVMSLGYLLVPSYVEDVRGLPVGLVGSLGAATAAGGVVWTFVLGRRHSRQALAAGAGLMALAFAGLLAAPGVGQVPAMVAVYFLLGIYLTARALSLGVVSEHTPLQHRGTAFGLVEMAFGIGAFVGPWAAGLLYAIRPWLPFATALALLVPLSGVIWLALRPADSAR